MLLKIENRALSTTTRWIEKLIADKYKVRCLPLSRYVTPLQVANLLHTKEANVWSLATESSDLHGVILNGVCLIHPDFVVVTIREKMKSLIRKELKMSKKVLDSLVMKRQNRSSE